MRKLQYLIIFLIFYSCSNSLEKSILTKLEVNELTKIIKKDTAFEETYIFIQQFRDSIKDDELKQVKWSELTYQSILDYRELTTDSNYITPLFDKYLDDWKEEFDTTGYKYKVDSISNYWRKLSDQNNLNGYLKVELVELDKEYYKYNQRIKDVNLGFRITPFKGRLDQVIFSYNLTPKISDSKNNSYLEMLDRKRCLYSSPIYSSTIGYWECKYSDRDLLEWKTVNELKRDYDLNIEIEEIRKDGRNLKKEDIDIPYYIEKLWESKKDTNDTWSIKYYRERIYQESIDKDYQELFMYQYDRLSKKRKEDFPLTHEFLELYTNHKYNLK